MQHRRPNEPHLIWSDYHNAWFRPEAHGYTSDIAKAGVFRGRGVNEEREHKVYFDEARNEINARTQELTRDLSNLSDLEQTLKLFVMEEPTDAPAPRGT